MMHQTRPNISYASNRFTDSIAEVKQAGVTLIEVLVTMLILAFGSLAIVNLQTSSAVAIGSSSDHFRINELSLGIVEQLKADVINAAAGNYNTDFVDTEAPANASAQIANRINEWKSSVARSIPQGKTRIQCSESECEIALKWHETSHSSTSDQTFNIKTPL